MNPAGCYASVMGGQVYRPVEENFIQTSQVFEQTADSPEKGPPTDEKIFSMSHVTPETAAAYLGVDCRFIRYGLQSGRLPFGTAVKRRQWSYHIPGPALVRYKYEGVPVREPAGA